VGNGAQPPVAVGVPERAEAIEVVRYLEQHGVSVAEIGPDGPRRYDAVHVGTLHRFKGLAYVRDDSGADLPRQYPADVDISAWVPMP